MSTKTRTCTVTIPAGFSKSKKMWRRDIFSIDPNQKGGYKFEFTKWYNPDEKVDLPEDLLLLVYDKGNNHNEMIRIFQTGFGPDNLSCVYQYTGKDWADKACEYIQTNFPHKIPVIARKVTKKPYYRRGRKRWYPKKNNRKPVPAPVSIPVVDVSTKVENDVVDTGATATQRQEPENPVQNKPETEQKQPEKELNLDDIFAIDDEIKRLKDKIAGLESRRMELMMSEIA